MLVHITRNLISRGYIGCVNMGAVLVLLAIFQWPSYFLSRQRCSAEHLFSGVYMAPVSESKGMFETASTTCVSLLGSQQQFYSHHQVAVCPAGYCNLPFQLLSCIRDILQYLIIFGSARDRTRGLPTKLHSHLFLIFFETRCC